MTLLKISMNANIVKTQIFHKIKFELKGHSRSQTMTFLFKVTFSSAAEHYERTKFNSYKDDICLILFTDLHIYMTFVQNTKSFIRL